MCFASGALADAAAKASVRLDLEAPPAVRALVEARLSLKDATPGEFELRRRLAQALEESRDTLESEGFYAARIDASLNRDGDIWVARFHVIAGEQTRVCAVNLVIAGSILDPPLDAAAPTPESVKAAWSLPQGAPFRHADWENAKSALVKTASTRIFANALISESRAEVDLASNCARLSVTLNSGAPVRFGKLEVNGLKRYDARIIENVNVADEGNLYDIDALTRFQWLIQQSGLFSSVNVTSQADSPLHTVAHVRVRVEENRLKTLNLGAGYSTNTGYRGQVDYVQNNVFGTSLQLSTSLKLETKAQSARGDLVWPRRSDGWQWGVGSRLERKDVQDVITRTYSNFGQVTKTTGVIDRQWTLGYLTEDQEVKGQDVVVNRTLSLNHIWTLRRLTPALFPQDGHAITFQLGGASRALLSEQDFVRAYAKAVVLQPLTPEMFLTLRGEAGVVAARSRDGIPLDFLFRTGGSSSVRGYGYESLGVKQDTAVVGGRYLAVGSIELTRWFNNTWGGAVFVDAGNATDNWQDFKAAVGYGAGARLRTPVGPLSLDLAFADETRTLRLHFNLSIPF